jgi:hypothetical protein
MNYNYFRHELENYNRIKAQANFHEQSNQYEMNGMYT